ncbi:TraB/GumN family protein [bacterium]|nr:TraB/GumN family protein [bacterium]
MMNKIGNSSIKTCFGLWLFCILIAHNSQTYAQDYHCLWKLSSRKGTLFFLGSVHLLSEADYPLDPCIENAYENSEAVYFEVNMDSASSMRTQQKIMMAGMLKNQTLADVISDSTYQILARELEKYGIQISMLSGLKPWMVASMLTMAKLNALGIDQQYGIDQYYYHKAKHDNKRIGGMESIEDQIRCFDALDNELKDDMLLESIQSLDDIESEFFHLKNAWKTGQTAEIDSVINRHMNEYPELKKILLDGRNNRWMQRVERMIENQEKAMIVVGTGHLVGEGSLIHLLRDRGYKVRQM